MCTIAGKEAHVVDMDIGRGAVGEGQGILEGS
jgi:hypothetical protein